MTIKSGKEETMEMIMELFINRAGGKILIGWDCEGRQVMASNDR